jgi:hypothetical protein
VEVQVMVHGRLLDRGPLLPIHRGSGQDDDYD